MEDQIKLSNYKDACACQEVISRDYFTAKRFSPFFLLFFFLFSRIKQPTLSRKQINLFSEERILLDNNFCIKM